MDAFILRHGAAELSARTDFERALNSRGRAQVAQAVQERSAELAGVKCMFVSPLLRAQQTAEIVLDQLGKRPAQTCDWLVPEARLDRALTELSNLSEESSILLISHLPLVAELTEALCGKPRGFAQFDTASLAALSGDILAAGCAELRWIRHVN
ncbi:phosphohistidine phosphatase SixA [Teredinibacter turnerae]|uniref:phosphohistidine phosphatase SixA n=1 Tax=Teredinibacter turnerae TaxID=2426 RepID=UPI0003727A15|nr:phosphohistidine phosphatase SixA [Teredinibacter turnerae]